MSQYKAMINLLEELNSEIGKRNKQQILFLQKRIFALLNIEPLFYPAAGCVVFPCKNWEEYDRTWAFIDKIFEDAQHREVVACLNCFSRLIVECPTKERKSLSIREITKAWDALTRPKQQEENMTNSILHGNEVLARVSDCIYSCEKPRSLVYLENPRNYLFNDALIQLNQGISHRELEERDLNIFWYPPSQLPQLLSSSSRPLAPALSAINETLKQQNIIESLSYESWLNDRRVRYTSRFEVVEVRGTWFRDTMTLNCEFI